ncbi:MAG: intradiol ring-cleavage dioxygenase [Nitrospira sp.]|nr:intradiol ring-cleavage dioxygenase [Nitrospira sp.]
MTAYDEHKGCVLSRREVMTLLGASSAAWFLGDSLASRRASAGLPQPSCLVRPEQTEGPYFVDEQLNRSDIRSDPSTGQVKPGTPLTLMFQVMRISAGACRPLSGALIDIWHCDAMGVYSDVQDPGFNTLGQKFLRGCQIADAGGSTQFLTIYPGWYPIRTVHIHFKIRTAPVAKKSFAFTSQVYFPDELTDQVHASPPYSSLGPRRVRNRHDFIFRDGGNQLMLAPSQVETGYTAAFSIALQFP